MLELTLMNGPAHGQVFHLPQQQPALLGRQSPQVPLNDARVSRRHAQIYFKDGRWLIEDLHSTNGTFVNDQLIGGPTPLHEGDSLRIGRLLLVVTQIAPQPSDPPAPASGPLAMDEDEIAAALAGEADEPPSVDLLEPPPPPPARADLANIAPQEVEEAPPVPQPSALEQVEGLEPPPPTPQPKPNPANQIEQEEESALSPRESQDQEDEPLAWEPEEVISPPQPQPQPQPQAADREPSASLDAQARSPLSPPPEATPPPEVSPEVIPSPEVLSEAPSPPEVLPKTSPAGSPPAPAAPLTKAQKTPDRPPEEPAQTAGSRGPRAGWLVLVFGCLILASVGVGWMMLTQKNALPPQQTEQNPSTPAAPLPISPVAEASEQTPPLPPVAPPADDAVAQAGDAGQDTGQTTPAAASMPHPPASAALPPAQQASRPSVSLFMGESPRLIGKAVLAGRVGQVASTPTGASASELPPNESPLPSAVVVEAASSLPQAPLQIPVVPAVDEDEPASDAPASLATPSPLADLADTEEKPSSGPLRSSQSPPPAQEAAPAQTAIIDGLGQAPPAEEGRPGRAWQKTFPTSSRSASAASPQAASPIDEPAPQEEEASLSPRQVVYLVDASGSQVDTLPQMINWLDQQIRRLGQRHAFTVIFFRQGQAIEPPPAGLKPAQPQIKQQVLAWMDPSQGHVVPGGRSELTAALTLAMSYPVNEIYLLSDGALGGRDNDRETVRRLIETLRTHLGSRPVAVHTVQFFYRDGQEALRTIAEQFGGTYQLIEPAGANSSAYLPRP